MERLLYCTCTYQLCESVFNQARYGLWLLFHLLLITFVYYGWLWVLRKCFLSKDCVTSKQILKRKATFDFSFCNLLKKPKTAFQKWWTAEGLELPASRLLESWLSGMVSIYCPLLVSSLNLMFQTWLVCHLSHHLFAICWQCKWYSRGKTDLEIITDRMKCRVLNCQEMRMITKEVLRSWIS